MSGFEQGRRGIDALLGGFQIVWKIETEGETEGDVCFGDKTAILRVLRGVEGLAGKFAGELRRGHPAGAFFNLAFKHCALHRGLQHARSSFEDAVFFFCAEPVSGGSLGGGVIEFAVV